MGEMSESSVRRLARRVTSEKSPYARAVAATALGQELIGLVRKKPDVLRSLKDGSSIEDALLAVVGYACVLCVPF